MPEMDGIGFHCELQKDDALSSIPFLMVTAESNGEALTAIKEAQIKFWVNKPLTADKLQAALGKLAAAGLSLSKAA